MFLCCGDALFDLFVDPAASVADPTRVALAGGVGGSPLNVAVGLARLRQSSRYFTRLSHDVFGQRMRRFMDDNAVDRSLCVDTDQNTTLAIVETREDGSARYVFYTDNTADASIEQSDLPASLPPAIRCLHFGSYSTALRPTGESLLALARRESASRVISYDPNLRLSIEPDVDRWRDIARGYQSIARVIKASDEDIASLLGSGREDAFVADCFDAGAQLVFITRGPDGASGFAADGRQARVAGVAVDVIDTVGAGDTFQASLLHWLAVEGHLAGDGQLTGVVDLDAAMTFAIRAASITCSRRGADLPTLEDVS